MWYTEAIFCAREGFCRTPCAFCCTPALQNGTQEALRGTPPPFCCTQRPCNMYNGHCTWTMPAKAMLFKFCGMHRLRRGIHWPRNGRHQPPNGMHWSLNGRQQLQNGTHCSLNGKQWDLLSLQRVFVYCSDCLTPNNRRTYFNRTVNLVVYL